MSDDDDLWWSDDEDRFEPQADIFAEELRRRGIDGALGSLARQLTTTDTAAIEAIDRFSDLKAYLADTGGPLISDDRLLMHVTTAATPSAIPPTDLIGALPHDLVRDHNIDFVVPGEPKCMQQDIIHRVCHNAGADEQLCYARHLGLNELAVTNSQVVLSRKLLSFLCSFVYEKMHDMQRTTFRILEERSKERRFRERLKKGNLQLTFSLCRPDRTVLGEVYVTATDFAAEDYEHRNSPNHFVRFLKNRVKYGLLHPMWATIEALYFKNREVYLTFRIENYE